MGLLTIIKKAKAKEKELRLLMVGLDNAGKTSIVCRLNGEELSTVLPTMGFNIDTLQYKGYRLNVWDIGGQKTIQSFWRNYFEATDGLIWVVDSTDKTRMADCRTELHKLMKEERLAGASLLVLANKQDLSGSLTPEEISTALGLEIMASDRHWSIQGASAYTGAGLLEGIDWIVDDVAARIFMHE